MGKYYRATNDVTSSRGDPSIINIPASGRNISCKNEKLSLPIPQDETPSSSIKNRKATQEKTQGNKPLFNKILAKIVTACSVLGVLGSLASMIITICSFAGMAICPPLAAIGLIAAGISLLGIVLDIINRATDNVKYDTGRNQALGVQIGGKIANIVSLAVNFFFPGTGVIINLLGLFSSAVGLSGYYVELNNDYKNRKLLQEYGNNIVGKTLTRLFNKIKNESISQIKPETGN